MDSIKNDTELFFYDFVGIVTSNRKV